MQLSHKNVTGKYILSLMEFQHTLNAHENKYIEYEKKKNNCDCGANAELYSKWLCGQE